MTADVVVAVLAFAGAGLGSALAYLATRSATAAERQTRRREEWGRRFTTALEALTSDDVSRRAVGRALLVTLLSSPLAGADDRQEAEAVLAAAATLAPRGNLRSVVPPADLDDLEIVQDTGHDEQGRQTI